MRFISSAFANPGPKRPRPRSGFSLSVSTFDPRSDHIEPARLALFRKEAEAGQGHACVTHFRRVALTWSHPDPDARFCLYRDSESIAPRSAAAEEPTLLGVESAVLPLAPRLKAITNSTADYHPAREYEYVDVEGGAGLGAVRTYTVVPISESGMSEPEASVAALWMDGQPAVLSAYIPPGPGVEPT